MTLVRHSRSQRLYIYYFYLEYSYISAIYAITVSNPLTDYNSNAVKQRRLEKLVYTHVNGNL